MIKTSPKDEMIKVSPKTKKKEIAVRENQNSPEQLIAMAIQNGTPVETMERILAMAKDVKAEQAKEAFNNAMADFQGECPTIKKTRGVPLKSGKIAYHYAPIDSIVNQVKDLIKKYGFSYMIKTETLKNEKGETSVKSICIVKHRLGHAEQSEMEVPLGNKTDIMSSSQVVASASTFSKRYAFCNAFGIMTGDEDDDARTTKTVEIVSDYDRAMNMISKANDIDGLDKLKEKIKLSKKYDDKQKQLIITNINLRIDKLTKK